MQTLIEVRIFNQIMLTKINCPSIFTPRVNIEHQIYGYNMIYKDNYIFLLMNELQHCTQTLLEEKILIKIY
jgi:hypothetical protein